jgi:hypothetical protein
MTVVLLDVADRPGDDGRRPAICSFRAAEVAPQWRTPILRRRPTTLSLPRLRTRGAQPDSKLEIYHDRRSEREQAVGPREDQKNEPMIYLY